jgi:serine/threonine-protein kinase RsbW
MSDTVELSIPARPELLSLARLAVAAVAARAGFDFEEIEDLRLALDELCAPLIGSCEPVEAGTGSADPPADPSPRLTLVLTWDDESIEVRCQRSGPASDTMDAFEQDLSDRILDALVDEHGRHGGNEVQAWLRKHRSAPTEPAGS